MNKRKVRSFTGAFAIAACVLLIITFPLVYAPSAQSAPWARLAQRLDLVDYALVGLMFLACDNRRTESFARGRRAGAACHP